MKRLIKINLQTAKRLLFNFNEFMCVIPISRQLDFLVYERPGAWCDDEMLASLVADMRKIALAGQEGKEIPLYGPLAGERKDLKNRIITIAYDRVLNQPVGFSAQAYVHVREGAFSTEVVHLGLIYVDPSYQGKSVSYLLSLLPNVLILIKSGFRDTWISSVSQVPAVVGLVAANYHNVFPSPDAGARQSFMHRKLATLILEQHREVFGVGLDAEFDPRTQVIKNAYTGGSDNMKKKFADSTKHRSEAVNLMCEKGLNYERGDDFLQVGQLGFKGVTELFRSKIHNLSLFQISMNFSMMALIMTIMPVLRWIIPNHSFSQVRARALNIRNL